MCVRENPYHTFLCLSTCWVLLTEYIVFFDRALPCWALLGFSGNGIVDVDVMLFQQL